MHGHRTPAMRRAAAITVVAAVCLLLLTDSGAAETVQFNAALASEIAASPQATGRGSAILALDTDSKVVNWTVEYSGLASTPRALGCGALVTQSGPSILITGNLASPISGSKTLTDSEIAALRSGNWACVVDTAGEEDAIGGVLQAAR